MPLSIVPKDARRASDRRSMTLEVDHYGYSSHSGAGQSLDTLTRHEGYLSRIYSEGADDILSAAKTSSEEEVLGAIKRTGQKWEEELVRTVADARGGGVLAKAQYLNAHVHSNARSMQVEVLRKECERLRKLHARAVELGRSQLERTFQRWMGASLATAFGAWREAAKAQAKVAKENEMRRQLEVLKRELETQREEMERAHAVEVRRLKNQLYEVGGSQREIDRLREVAIRNALNRMQMAAAAAAFTKWAEIHRAARKARYVLKKVIMSRAARALNTWKALAEEKVRLRNKARQVAGRIIYRQLASAWSKWAMIKQERAQNRLKVKRMLSKMMNGILNRSFGRWADMVAELKNQRSRLSRIIYRARNQGMVPAFNRWIENMYELRRARTMVERVMTRARNRGMAMGFDRWYEAAKEIKSMRSRATRAMSRFRNRNLTQALMRWREFASECKMQRVALNRAIKKMKNRVLAAAFTRWNDYFKEKRKLRTLMMRAAQRFKNKPEGRAFARWTEFLEEKQRVLNQLDYITRRIRYRAKSEPFQRWVEMVYETQDLRAKVHQALARFKHGLLSRSWGAWIDIVDQAHAKREAAEAVLTRLKSRNLVASYNRWREFTDESVYMREKMASVIGRMQNAKLTRIWNTWYDFVKARHRLMTRLELMMARFVKRRMLAALNTWRAVVAETHEARAEAARQAKLSAAERERERAEKEAHEAAVKAKRNSRLAKGTERILRRIMSRIAAMAFDGWCDRVRVGRDKKKLARKMLVRVKHRQLGMAFAGWIHGVNILQRQRHVVGRALARMRRVTRIQVFLAWASVARIDRVEHLERRAEAAERVLGIRTRHNMAICVPLLRQLTAVSVDADLNDEIFALFDFLVPKSMTSKQTGKLGLSKEALDVAGNHVDLLDIAARGRLAVQDLENPQQSEKRFRAEQRVVEIVNSQLSMMRRRLDELEDQNRNLRIERETTIQRVTAELEKKHKFDIAALRRLNAQETRETNERARLSRLQERFDDRMLVATNNSSAFSTTKPTPGMMPSSRSGSRTGGRDGNVLSPHASGTPSPMKSTPTRLVSRSRPVSASFIDRSPAFNVEGTSATKAYRPTTFQPPPGRKRMAFD